MSNSPHDAVVIILDIGKSVSILADDEHKSFYEQSKECVSWIIQRKLISESPDVLALLLIGSDDDNDHLIAKGYKNICCKFEFQHASWEMLKYIELEVQTTEHQSDWFGAIMISLEMLKAYEEYSQVQNKKIVFFSDFSIEVPNNLDILCKKLETSGINISIIGPKNLMNLTFEDSELEFEPPSKRAKNINKISQETRSGKDVISFIWRKLPEQIVICSFESALKQLCSYTRKPIRKTPWNCVLDIGDIKIKISMFKNTDPKSSKKFETNYVKSSQDFNANRDQLPSQLTEDEIVPVVRDKVMHYKHQTGKDGEFVDVEVGEEDTIEGFRYGATIVPFSEVDKAAMGYSPGEKCFSVIGFTNISSVPFYLFSGECSSIVQARENDKNAEVALSAVIQAMKHLECLAIVRKVYSKDRGLSLGVLYPCIEESEAEESEGISSKECLLFIELAFEEEVKSINFPPLENFAKEVTKEQFAAVDSLIESMDLMNAEIGLRGEPAEAFDILSLHDFKEQFYHYCVIQRGLYPNRPLPTTIPSYIENYIKLPRSVDEKSKIPLKKIKEVFTVSEMRKFQKETESLHGTSEVPVAASWSGEVSTADHFSKDLIAQEQNFVKRKIKELFSKNFPEMKEFEKTLLECESENVSDTESGDIAKRVGEVIAEVRLKYLVRNPDLYNWWIGQFKYFSQKESGPAATEIWDFIVSENLGLVSEKENELSRVPEDEAEDFLHMGITESLSCSSPKRKRSDFESPPKFTQDESFEELMLENDFP